MSANRYTFCPRCISEKRRKIERRKIEELEIALDEGYGNLSKEEWLNKRELLIYLELKKDEETLGEYYDIWIEEKESPPRFFVQYSCSCESCKFVYSFTHEEVIDTGVQDNDQ